MFKRPKRCHNELNSLFMQFKSLQLVSGKWLLVLIKSFFNGLIKPSDRHPYCFLSRGFILIVWGSTTSFSESAPILGYPGAFFAQYFFTRVDFPSPPLCQLLSAPGSLRMVTPGIESCPHSSESWKVLLQSNANLEICECECATYFIGNDFSNKSLYTMSRKASWSPGTERCRKVINFLSRAKHKACPCLTNHCDRPSFTGGG